MIDLPPRHGKSTLTSHYFPAWYLGTRPDERVMLVSYEADFAASWGAKARDTLLEWGKPIFGVSVSKDSSAKNAWNLEDRAGGMVTAGAGGAITGRGADLLIIEDPVKNAEQAHSETYREHLWDWWQSTAYTRLEPDGVCVVIQTRWDEQDLIGKLLLQMAEPGGEQWDLIHLPAIAEDDEDWGFWQRSAGDALWDRRYPLAELERIRANQSDYWWNALYQGRPIPLLGGGMFQTDSFVLVDAVPAGVPRVRFWDTAATEKTNSNEPDWTVGLRIGLSGGIYWIDDIVRVQLDPGGVETLIRDTAKKDGRGVRVVIAQEPGSSGKTVIHHYQTQVLVGFSCDGWPETGSKIVRAWPASSAAKAKNVRLLRAPWNRPFIEECVAFPFGRHDDQVDAFSGGLNALAETAMRPFAAAAGGERPLLRAAPRMLGR